MNDRMLAKQNDFPGRADKQLSTQCQLLDCSTNRLSNTKDGRTDIFAFKGIKLDSAGGNKRTFQVVQEIMRVFDTNTQANEILWQTAGCASSRVDRCVAMWISELPTNVLLKNKLCSRHDAGHTNQAIHAAKTHANAP